MAKKIKKTIAFANNKGGSGKECNFGNVHKWNQFLGIMKKQKEIARNYIFGPGGGSNSAILSMKRRDASRKRSG